MSRTINPDGAILICVERRRQIIEKGWTAEHDDGHADGTLLAGAIQIACGVAGLELTTGEPTIEGPWCDQLAMHVAEKYGDDYIRRLTIAGAMIAAEIDRLQRVKERDRLQTVEPRITLGTDQPQKCPTCDSPSANLHPAMQFEGEVEICKDGFHGKRPDNEPSLELVALINRHGLENDSNTPDWILAKFFQSCLGAFATAVVSRDRFYDFDPEAMTLRGVNIGGEAPINSAVGIGSRKPAMQFGTPCKEMLQSFAEFDMPPADNSEEVEWQRVLYRIRDLAQESVHDRQATPVTEQALLAAGAVRSGIGKWLEFPENAVGNRVVVMDPENGPEWSYGSLKFSFVTLPTPSTMREVQSLRSALRG